jgi:hypothetical protein
MSGVQQGQYGLYYKTVSTFVANSNSFIDSNKNDKGMQTWRLWHMLGESCPTCNAIQSNKFEVNKIVIK